MVNEYQPDDLQDYLILSGEHLYRMDYSDLIRQHRKSGADITIATVGLGVSNPVLYGVDGTGVGLVEMNEDFRVLNFVEKPPRYATMDCRACILEEIHPSYKTRTNQQPSYQANFMLVRCWIHMR